MRAVLLMLLLLLGVSRANAGDLILVLKGKDLTGQALRVAVFSTPATFPAGESLRRLKMMSEGKVAELHVTELLPGSYAVSAYCDLNNNGKLDKNWLGKPIEPYGFSRNARAPFGPPPWSEAVVQIGTGAARQEITLR